MTNGIKDDSKAYHEWLDSVKAKKSRELYFYNWQIWLGYCKLKGIPTNASDQLEDIKKRRLSTDNTVKYFYDNEIPKFFKWLTTVYVSLKTNKHLSEASALAVTTTVRSFFSYHRYSLEIQKDKLPSSEEVKSVEIDHAFDIYQLRAMFQCGDLTERTILACGKDLFLRVSDITKLQREFIELLIKREKELAENEKRDTDIIEFELTTEKEKEPCSCHLSKESIELLIDYLKTTPKTEYLFPLTEDALNDVLKRLAEKSKITVNGRIRWHCLRKFGITLMHGKVTEPVMKYMTGKHISKDLRTYIQNNRETYKAFKLIEPLISLTKSNGQSSTLTKELEELKKENFKRMALLKLLEKVTPKKEMQKAILELAKEYDIEVKTTKAKADTGELIPFPQIPSIEDFVNQLGNKIEAKELKRILEENGNNH